jgi:hypothetical protein
MIWRDDDIAVTTRLEDLRTVDDLFQRYRVPHTIALIANLIDVNRPLVEFIRERHMIVQVHGWSHDDLTTTPAAVADLPKAIEMIERVFGQRPTVLYPPWNRTTPQLEAAAAQMGLRVDAEKISLQQFIRTGGDVREDTINFHYWNAPDVPLLDEALRLAQTAARRMTITVITPTCDRPVGIAVLERWMARQTRQPDEWIVADGGERPAVCAMGQTQVHRPRPAGVENFLGNLQAGLHAVTGDVIVWCEDDDWYAPTHLATLEQQLRDQPSALAAGDDNQRYYNLPRQLWRTWKNVGACLCQTALRREAVPRLQAAIHNCRERQSYGVDTTFWRGIPRPQRAIGATATVVGMKGLPGPCWAGRRAPARREVDAGSGVRAAARLDW